MISLQSVTFSHSKTQPVASQLALGHCWRGRQVGGRGLMTQLKIIKRNGGDHHLSIVPSLMWQRSSPMARREFPRPELSSSQANQRKCYCERHYGAWNIGALDTTWPPSLHHSLPSSRWRTYDDLEQDEVKISATTRERKWKLASRKSMDRKSMQWMTRYHLATLLLQGKLAKITNKILSLWSLGLLQNKTCTFIKWR